MKPQYITYFLIALFAVYIPIETLQHQDLDIFLLASKEYLQGGNIYEHGFENGFYFFYSPLFAMVLAPLTFLPVYAARIAWLLLNVLAFFRVLKLSKAYIDLSSYSQKQRLIFDVVVIPFSAKLLLDNFHNGQMTIFMLLFMLDGLRLINSGKEIAGTALIALGINFKFLPLVMLPYLFYNKQIKACFYIAGWYVVFLFVPVVMHGWDAYKEILSSWLGKVNPTSARHVIDTDETTLNGLSTVIPTLLMEKVPDIHALTLKRNFMDLDAAVVAKIINVIRLIFLVFTLYFLRRKPFSTAPGSLHKLWELGFVFMLIPLIFPHQQHYAFFMMFPAALYVIYWLFEQRRKGHKVPVAVYVVLGLIYLLTNAHLLLGEFREYYDHYKIITYGALLMVGLLAYLKPSRFTSEK